MIRIEEIETKILGHRVILETPILLALLADYKAMKECLESKALRGHKEASKCLASLELEKV